MKKLFLLIALSLSLASCGVVIGGSDSEVKVKDTKCELLTTNTLRVLESRAS